MYIFTIWTFSCCDRARSLQRQRAGRPAALVVSIRGLEPGSKQICVVAPIFLFPTCLMQSISWAITFSRFGPFPVVTAPALCSAKGRGALPLWLYRIQDWSLAASRLAFWHRSALLQPAYCRVIAGLLHFYDLDNFPVATAPALSSPHFFTLPDTCLMQGISWAITFSRFGLCPIVTAPALCNAKGRGALPL